MSCAGTMASLFGAGFCRKPLGQSASNQLDLLVLIFLIGFHESELKEHRKEKERWN